METLKVISWNCQGFKSNGPWLVAYIKEFDIIALQETWLLESESILIDQLYPDYYVIHKSAMPNTFLPLKGRPYGGVAFLVRKRLKGCVDLIKQDDCRLLALNISTKRGSLLLINVYFPVNCISNEELIIQYISRIEAKVKNHNGPSVICGDFNLSKKSPLFKEIISFCEDNNHRALDLDLLPADTFTFCSKGSGHTSWIDHFLVSKDICDISNIEVLNDLSPSDHVPVLIQMRMGVSPKPDDLISSASIVNAKINWKKLSVMERLSYHQSTEQIMHDLLTTRVLCVTPLCNCSDHHNAISGFYDDIISRVKTCANVLQRKIKFGKTKAF